MRVFIAGATGVLGRRLVRGLVARGHPAVGLVRDAAKAAQIEAAGGEARVASLFDAGALARAMAGCDAVVHAATSIPAVARPNARHWAVNDRIRREGTAALVTAAAEVGAKHYVQQSILWLARPPDDSFFDEDAPPRPDAVTASAWDGERVARAAGVRHGFAVAILRCGFFYGADAAHTRVLGQGVMRGRIPVIGKGGAIWPCLHLDDAASAFQAALERRAAGLWHVVDDRSFTAEEFLVTLAELLGAKPLRHAPRWLARLLAGKEVVEFFTRSTRTSNARFKQDVGWAPRYPDVHAGLKQVVAAWREEGFLVGERGKGAGS